MLTERYRPETIKHLIVSAMVGDFLKNIEKTKDCPHLLLAGMQGVGKTTAAIVIAKALFPDPDEYDQMVYELNASDDRGIAVVRGRIKEIASNKSPIIGRHKIIILDEVDFLTKDAQAALRRTMEKFWKNCRFILTCNYPNQIIKPIQSRCLFLRFHKPTLEQGRTVIQRVIDGEKRIIDPKAVDMLYQKCGGDLRQMIICLDYLWRIRTEIGPNDLIDYYGFAEAEDCRRMLKFAVEGKIPEAVSLVESVLSNTMGYEELGLMMFKQIINSNWKQPFRDHGSYLCARFVNDITNGCNPVLSFGGLFSKISFMFGIGICKGMINSE